LWIKAALKILNLAVKEGEFRVERKASVKTDFSCSVEVSTPTELISGKVVCNQSITGSANMNPRISRSDIGLSTPEPNPRSDLVGHGRSYVNRAVN
jgi:hypothetical protein